MTKIKCTSYFLNTVYVSKSWQPTRRLIVRVYNCVYGGRWTLSKHYRWIGNDLMSRLQYLSTGLSWTVITLSLVNSLWILRWRVLLPHWFTCKYTDITPVTQQTMGVDHRADRRTCPPLFKWGDVMCFVPPLFRGAFNTLRLLLY